QDVRRLSLRERRGDQTTSDLREAFERPRDRPTLPRLRRERRAALGRPLDAPLALLLVPRHRLVRDDAHRGAGNPAEESPEQAPTRRARPATGTSLREFSGQEDRTLVSGR